MGRHGDWDERDALHLRQAIRLSAAARARGNKPFGAVIAAADGTVLAQAGNTGTETRDFTAHAEMNALRAAAALHPRDALAAATLYASGEPCAMCAGAIFWSGIARVVFALDIAAQRRAGKPAEVALSCRDVLHAAPRPITVLGPCLAGEALEAFKDAW